MSKNKKNQENKNCPLEPEFEGKPPGAYLEDGVAYFNDGAGWVKIDIKEDETVDDDESDYEVIDYRES